MFTMSAVADIGYWVELAHQGAAGNSSIGLLDGCR